MNNCSHKWIYVVLALLFFIMPSSNYKKIKALDQRVSDLEKQIAILSEVK